MCEFVFLEVSFNIWSFMSSKTRISSFSTNTLPACRNRLIWRVAFEDRLSLKLSLKIDSLVLRVACMFYQTYRLDGISFYWTTLNASDTNTVIVSSTLIVSLTLVK